MQDFQDQRTKLQDDIEKLTHHTSRLRRINGSWDASLTITTIILTLMITILASLNQIDEQNKKVTTSVLGAVIITIQAIGNAFPVKQKAGSYRLLQAQASNLLIDAQYVENMEELKNLSSQYSHLNIESAKVEIQ
ncbi:hypothetical protein GNF10_00585 [Nostoc sp. UCD121]|uniref:hypothetical protein n=1 Tax=unclassified Nostoc TaxID=2593658 RepID=UPI001628504E|nr:MULTISPECIES: hypothetical protein [unclassified Nostoc]MBC1223505.1 hypothetical protein [Nostoc sp. UCD120]MBC1274512.1 hypothetical protein [Nostoc sp. UCD121]MBC1294004.1 hypothetical protein [Nostoc sp. UCD122]